MDLVKHISEISDIETDYEKVLANLYYTHFWLSDKYNTILGQYGITTQQSTVLGAVHYSHPNSLTLTELKGLMLEKNSDVSRIVSRLILKGYLRKNPNPINKRKIEISITQKGFNLMEKIQEQHLYKKFTSDLSTAEARQLITLLAKLRKE